MPIPKPKKDEKEKDFISRCVSTLADEEKDGEKRWPDNDQRVAVCYSAWEEKNEESVINRIDQFLDEETVTGDVAQYSKPLGWMRKGDTMWDKSDKYSITWKNGQWCLYKDKEKVQCSKSYKELQKIAQSMEKE